MKCCTKDKKNNTTEYYINSEIIIQLKVGFGLQYQPNKQIKNLLNTNYTSYT